MLGGAMVPTALPGTPLLQKGVETLAGAAMTGTGAAAGSLVSEPFAPTSTPLETARTTGKEMALWEGGFRLGSKLLGALFGPSRFFAPRGEEAAQTFKEEGMITPATVTTSMIPKAVEAGAEGAIVGGSFLRRARMRGEQRLTGRLEETQAHGALPTDTAVRAALDTHGYQPGFTDAAKATQAQARQALYTELDTMMANRVATQGTPVPISSDVRRLATQLLPQEPPGTPLHAALTGLTTTARLTTPQLQALTTTVRAGGANPALSPEAGAAFDTLVTNLSNAIEHPTVLNMRGLAGPIAQLRQDASGMISPDMHTLLDRVSAAGYRMSLRDARNLRSDLMQMTTGGSLGMSAPNPVTGAGNPLAPRLRRQVNILADAIETNIETQTGNFGADIYTTYRLAQDAAKVGAKQRWLEEFLSGTDVYDPDRGMFKGSGILRKLENISNYSKEGLKDFIGVDTIANIEKYANALAKMQETSGESPASVYHQVLRLAMRTAQLGGATYAAMQGYPGAGLLIATTPEAMAVVMSQKNLSNLLVSGINAPPGAKYGWEALGRVAGALHAAGVQPYAPPSQGQQPQPSSGRLGTFLKEYQQSLGAAPMDKAEQYWRDVLASHPDADARAAFQQAFAERFGRPVGGEAALVPSGTP